MCYPDLVQMCMHACLSQTCLSAAASCAAVCIPAVAVEKALLRNHVQLQHGTISFVVEMCNDAVCFQLLAADIVLHTKNSHFSPGVTSRACFGKFQAIDEM